jgi:hypothetical protein
VGTPTVGTVGYQSEVVTLGIEHDVLRCTEKSTRRPGVVRVPRKQAKSDVLFKVLVVAASVEGRGVEQ